ncbi:PD-(D/E)XK motif protein [Sinorhizobium meliloti]|uniref:PD-(D/E)XK motif protein n=1 Tax=Rhizobium meliloti TaxID=382 RepID=UPI000FD887FF|nr:PD-(D/E)XK motif protein [Sinorhizobium meliloti]RVG77430.1 PD-(D/E)XK motif protein [Sinorhizobium meliloti]RVI30993.1 PD-(D/E)XK motif protein [Sinorhizobium meliloti]RVI39144.1 PD-(D/E)XK motif protein [Sinorhizobium meliloti]RVJ18131.1 PD-(D/E)XK motif protein [Sinorhizobium meliloti]RVJ87241.1 PD-(D/E)XK motif protein [Sinorhizobium meliloti]
MAEEPNPEAWAELRSGRPISDDALVTRGLHYRGEETAILMGMDVEGDLHLLVPVSEGPSFQAFPDLNGLMVRHRVTSEGQFLGLVATAPHERVFNPVCREVVEAVLVQNREPWAAAASIIRQWQSAWRPTRQYMSQTTQVGLAGELIVLAKIMIDALGARAVLLWSGPESERHDFVSGNLHLEVKTTRASRHEHDISRLDQLWAPDDRRLLLASVQLEASIGGTLTIASLIDEVIDLIRDDPAAVDDFLLKLSRLNWSDEMRRSGELLRFHLREAALYDVDDEFPRLNEDFRPPSGVLAVRYTVSLANLPTLGVDEVIGMVRASQALR